MKDMMHQEITLTQENAQSGAYTFKKRKPSMNANEPTTSTSTGISLTLKTRSFNENGEEISTTCQGEECLEMDNQGKKFLDLVEFTGKLTDDEQQMFESLMHKKFGPETTKEIEELVMQSPKLGKQFQKYISEKQKQQQDPDDSSNLDEKNQVIQRKMEQMNKEAKMKMKMQMISSQRQDSIDQMENL
ncbi:hypothetical protein WR25_22405 [Diploscapter pachys]|uniref:Uncharacterized protein n=1 Tax=Diploscapter pachys TaxID=2018661 RepID=A0A2A2JJF9_9BILA|nr:hypothetical protein WR25_22405 [Diploscapter pachys]